MLGHKYIPELSSDTQVPQESTSLIPFSSILETVVPPFELQRGVLASNGTTGVATVYLKCGYFI